MLVALRQTTPSPPTLIALFGLPALLAAFVGWWRQDATVIVGADGVWIGRPLRYRFVPVQDIAAVELPEALRETGETLPFAALQIVLRGGEHVRLQSSAGTQLEVIAEAIRDIVLARDASRARALSQLERKGRTLADWRAALRGLSESNAGFREAAISREQIEAALDDATLPAEQRLGAAIALGELGGADRVRIAAEASAEPRMRVVLSRIAGGLEAEDAELLTLLDEEAAQAASSEASSPSS